MTLTQKLQIKATRIFFIIFLLAFIGTGVFCFVPASALEVIPLEDDQVEALLQQDAIPAQTETKAQETTESVETSESAGTTESTDKTGATESADKTGTTEATYKTGATESADKTGATESTDKTETTGAIESAEKTGTTESTDKTGATESTDKTGATDKQESSHIQKQAQKLLDEMSLEQKVNQMFIITPEALTGVSTVTQAGDTTKNALAQYPVGGLIYMEPNIASGEQITQMLSSVQTFSLELTSLPLFLCVDEEGGTVARLSGRLSGVPYIPDMLSVGAGGDPSEAYSIGSQIGSYLKDYGFNVDFAPVADVVADPGQSAIGTRSFGYDPQIDAAMVASLTEGLQNNGTLATLKHFPGHGAVDTDTHASSAESYKTIDELREEDLVPFQSGIEAGAAIVMAGHLAFPAITGDSVPASLSPYFLSQLLRMELGFEGLIITDALGMGAITNTYSSAEAAVMAVNAGVDLLLMPADFHAALQGILDAVKNGDVTQERIDTSVLRIIEAKLSLLQNG